MSLDSYDRDHPKDKKGDLIQDFLTQRSVQVRLRANILSLFKYLIGFGPFCYQTLMHNMKLVGDTESLEFLENFMDHQGLPCIPALIS
jgi:hypothetical protein